MNEDKLFDFKGNDVRIIDRNGEPRFVAKDVCAALGIDTSNLTKVLDGDERSTCPVQYTDQVRNSVIINESGMYSLVLRSRKPEAKAFKKWVTSEVLPSIRKHGAYMTNEVIEKTLNDPDFIIKLATKLKEERAKVKALEAEVEKNKPLVTFAKQIAVSDATISVGTFAKVLSDRGVMVGRNRLFAWLRNSGYIYGSARGLEPYQRYMERGLFSIKESLVASTQPWKHYPGHYPYYR